MSDVIEFKMEVKRATRLLDLLGSRTPFEIPDGPAVVLNGLDMEDGSGWSWCFRGYVRDGSSGANVHGWFNERRGSGWYKYTE